MIENLSKKLGVKFKNQDLLQSAVTHRSYLNENRSYGIEHNERLEFLGDAVLELIITEYLYKTYSNPEGELTSWRSALVNGENLAKIAGELGVEEFLLMSKGEAKDTGRARQYLLANALEAIIGAIYLDRGYQEVQQFVLKYIVANLDEVLKKGLYLDAKSVFQEKSQEEEKITPSYRVLEEWGPDHDRHFVVGVFLGEELIAKGEGKSKQEAQREAAKKGLEVKRWM
ncbi:MAG: ribonuclease III [Candidatus Moranbacteria bacterium]|nr:ribonuclease III [Candidatus Moranbacteria bacterium]